MKKQTASPDPALSEACPGGFHFDQWLRERLPQTPEERAKSPVATGPDAASIYGPHDVAVLKILRKRDGAATELTLSSGERFQVFRITWGYDQGDPVAHVMADLQPDPGDSDVKFFFTNEVVRLADPETGAVWLSDGPEEERDDGHLGC